jgi:hypothetical protein
MHPSKNDIVNSASKELKSNEVGVCPIDEIGWHAPLA